MFNVILLFVLWVACVAMAIIGGASVAESLRVTLETNLSIDDASVYAYSIGVVFACMALFAAYEMRNAKSMKELTKHSSALKSKSGWPFAQFARVGVMMAIMAFSAASYVTQLFSEQIVQTEQRMEWLAKKEHKEELSSISSPFETSILNLQEARTTLSVELAAKRSELVSPQDGSILANLNDRISEARLGALDARASHTDKIEDTIKEKREGDPESGRSFGEGVVFKAKAQAELGAEEIVASRKALLASLVGERDALVEALHQEIQRIEGDIAGIDTRIRDEKQTLDQELDKAMIALTGNDFNNTGTAVKLVASIVGLVDYMRFDNSGIVIAASLLVVFFLIGLESAVVITAALVPPTALELHYFQRQYKLSLKLAGEMATEGEAMSRVFARYRQSQSIEDLPYGRHTTHTPDNDPDRVH